MSLLLLNLDKSNNTGFITEQTVFSTARLVCSEIDMETTPQSRVSELIVELDMFGLIAAEVPVQGDDKKVLDAEITANVDDIHHGLTTTQFSHLDFHRPTDTQVTTT